MCIRLLGRRSHCIIAIAFVCGAIDACSSLLLHFVLIGKTNPKQITRSPTQRHAQNSSGDGISCPHHRRCRQSWHQPVRVFFHPPACFLTTMALSFIGYVQFCFFCCSLTTWNRKPISLISHSDVRYRGILAGIDPAASTIQLSNGTRVPAVCHKHLPDP